MSDNMDWSMNSLNDGWGLGSLMDEGGFWRVLVKNEVGYWQRLSLRGSWI
jgi:hypothetical protein